MTTKKTTTEAAAVEAATDQNAVDAANQKALAKDQAEYIATQEKIAAQQDRNPAQPPVMATTLDIPSNMPYPTGKPHEPTYAEINGLPPAANVEEV